MRIMGMDEELIDFRSISILIGFLHLSICIYVCSRSSMHGGVVSNNNKVSVASLPLFIHFHHWLFLIFSCRSCYTLQNKVICGKRVSTGSTLSVQRGFPVCIEKTSVFFFFPLSERIGFSSFDSCSSFDSFPPHALEVSASPSVSDATPREGEKN